MPSRFERYQVRDDAMVTMDVIIGETQPGGTTAFLDTREIAHTKPGESGMNIHDCPVGTGAELRGKMLVITTNMLDLRDTDRASVTVVLRDGPVRTEVTQSKQGTPFKSVNFFTVIEFV